MCDIFLQKWREAFDSTILFKTPVKKDVRKKPETIFKICLSPPAIFEELKNP